MVAGDAVNVAARLEQAAEPGEVMVSERTARAGRGFLFEDVGPLELKGKGRAVRALRLAGESEVGDRGIAGLRAPMVGRDEELALLRTLYGRVAAEGHPHLVTIYGDAGVGKSRLTAEFLAWAEAEDPVPLVARGRCLPYGEGVTYWPLAEILKGLAGVLDTDPPALVVEKVEKLGRDVLGPDVPNSARATAALAYTVGVDVPGESFRDLTPRAVRTEVDAAWRAFFSGLSRERPVVAVVEDIHWADPAMLDLLEVLADRVQGPVLFMCPARPELTQRRSTWGGGKRSFSSMFLEPLTRADADRLIGFLLTVEDLPPSVHDRMLERAEGNPFFLEEIFRHLIDEGRIVRDGDRWRAAAEIEEVVIPDTVQAVLAARIDLLGAEEKRTLQLAAVVGRVFWPGPVARLLDGSAGELEDILNRLEERELVLARLTSTMADEREYMFKHVLTRDVAYESIPRRERFAAHASVASWIEGTVGERRGEFSELLAYHFAEAHEGARREGRAAPEVTEELRVKAVHHLFAAGENARARFALEAARVLAERALSVAADGVERSRAFEALGHTALAGFQSDMAWESFRAAVDERLASDPKNRMAIAGLCARAVEAPTRWPGAMTRIPPEDEVRRYLDLGFDNLEPGDSEERVRLLMAEAFWPWVFPENAAAAADQKALRAGNEAVEVADRLGRMDLVSAALDAVGSVYAVRGLAGRTAEVQDRRLAIVRRFEDPFELGDVHAVAAWVRVHIGRYREAIEIADEGVRRTRDAPPATLACLVWRAIARFRLGEWANALADIAQGEVIVGSLAEVAPSYARRLHGLGALIHELRGERSEADGYLQSLLRLLEPGPPTHHHEAPWVALVLARRGSMGQARAILDRQIAIPFQANRAPNLEALCDVVGEEEAWGDASEIAVTAREYAAEAELLALPLFVDRLEGRSALASGDLDRAIRLLERARDGFAMLEVRWEAACTDLSLAEALQAAGRSDEARAAATAALAVFDDLGSVREQARTQELLEALG